jgi:hypothetical protein
MASGDQGLQNVVLHLPASLRERTEEMANHEGISLNLFVLMAIAEKLQRLQLQHCLEIGEREELPAAADAALNALVH